LKEVSESLRCEIIVLMDECSRSPSADRRVQEPPGFALRS